jgi:ElaB/YqjD/DUF883 family membrane-anchored ribosome-binding protein
MNDMTGVTKDKLLADFRLVVADAEELLRLTANQAGDKPPNCVPGQDHLVVAKQKLGDADLRAIMPCHGSAPPTTTCGNPWRAWGCGRRVFCRLLISRR